MQVYLYNEDTEGDPTGQRKINVFNRKSSPQQRAFEQSCPNDNQNKHLLLSMYTDKQENGLAIPGHPRH